MTVVGHGRSYEADTRHSESLGIHFGALRWQKCTFPSRRRQPRAGGTIRPRTVPEVRFDFRNGRFSFDQQSRHTVRCERVHPRDSRPTMGDWEELKRLGRHFLGKPWCQRKCWFRKHVGDVTICSCANWASDGNDRAIISDWMSMLGRPCINRWNNTQSLVAVPSVESESDGVAKVTPEALWRR